MGEVVHVWAEDGKNCESVRLLNVTGSQRHKSVAAEQGSSRIAMAESVPLMKRVVVVGLTSVRF